MQQFYSFLKTISGSALLCLALWAPAQAVVKDDAPKPVLKGSSQAGSLPDAAAMQNVDLLASLFGHRQKEVESHPYDNSVNSENNSLTGLSSALFNVSHVPTNGENASKATSRSTASVNDAESAQKNIPSAPRKGSPLSLGAEAFGEDQKDIYTKLLIASRNADGTSNKGIVKDVSKCPQGKRWRIAVNQSGPFIDFRKVFRGMVLALTDDGLIRKYPPILNVDYKYDDPGNFDALATATKGGCIEFVSGTFSNYNWDRKGVLSDKLRIKKMIDEGMIDMIWTFGTISGLYFADSGLGVPVLVIDSTSPEGAGIIGPGDYSDKPNVHVQKDLTRYSAEVVLFHNLLKFKRMGILVDSNEDNQSGQDIFEIRALARTMGFELVPCYGDIMGRNPHQADADFKRCLTMLAEENLDALFLTLVYRPDEPLFPLIKPFIDRGIPVYSQYGESDVRGGALLSLSESDMTHAAIYQANVVRQIIVDGKKPEEISQHFHAPLSISFNMHTARLIEWQPSFEALIAIDNVYSTIEGANTCSGYNALMNEEAATATYSRGPFGNVVSNMGADKQSSATADKNKQSLSDSQTVSSG